MKRNPKREAILDPHLSEFKAVMGEFKNLSKNAEAGRGIIRM